MDEVVLMVENGGLKTVKNGPRVWAFCKIGFPGIQKPVQILDQKSLFFKKCGNRGVGVIWLGLGLVLIGCCLLGWLLCVRCGAFGGLCNVYGCCSLMWVWVWGNLF